MRRWLCLLGVIVVSAPPAGAAPEHKRPPTVMTYNIYQGTELEHVLAATTPSQLAIAVATDYNNVVATSFAERSKAIAGEVAHERPDLLALQEVALWRTRFPSNPALPALDVAYDSLQILLDALAAAGLHYAPVVVENNFDVQSPGLFPSGLMDVRLTDRTAILARTDLSTADLKLSNPQQQHFLTNSVIPTLGGPLTILGGWASVDVKVRGKTFRLITTHLDPISPAARIAQVAEMLQGPAATDIPLIMAGDFNSEPGTVAYGSIISAGFVDAWAHEHRFDPGYTCCQVPPDTIMNPVSNLTTRFDYVFISDGLRVIDIDLIGADPVDRTPSGLWPSDHAGLAATLQFRELHDRD